MAIIKQKDKRSGITYVYEATYWRDKEKNQSRSSRKLIGRLDEETGEILPTDGRNRKPKQQGNRDPRPEDYKAMYEKLLKKYEAREVFMKTLKEKLRISKKKINLKKDS